MPKGAILDEGAPFSAGKKPLFSLGF